MNQSQHLVFVYGIIEMNAVYHILTYRSQVDTSTCMVYSIMLSNGDMEIRYECVVPYHINPSHVLTHNHIRFFKTQKQINCNQRKQDKFQGFHVNHINTDRKHLYVNT